MGGENPTVARPEPRDAGSSPRGRGKRKCARLFPCPGGLIPAWAGKTRSESPQRGSSRAHPRVGGENPSMSAFTVGASGSSPRGRGKLLVEHTYTIWARLIPAWAGKTTRLAAHVPLAWAHPRVGGENGREGEPRHCASGSSPRGRGKLAHAMEKDSAPRLIPAWAGKTRASMKRDSTVKAHPRVGGENTPWPSPAWTQPGSSPRGRGKRHRHLRCRLQDRLIPAWAGKTRRCAAATWFATAHPRVGGENGQASASYFAGQGSSPRGRGKPDRSRRRPVRPRLIPAWAGKT